jgi:hypothetical protein
MRRLELDFELPRRPSWMLQALLLAIAVAFAGDVALSYVNAREQVVSLKGRLERMALARNGDASLVKVVAGPVSDEEYAFARETIRRLSTPWAELFAALEAARIDSVAIASVEPNPSDKTVAVQGEAKDYLAALSFVANLREQRALRGVRLVRHESSSGDPTRPVQFSLTASWGGR